jgi:hypothetical protein
MPFEIVAAIHRCMGNLADLKLPDCGAELRSSARPEAS